LDHGIELSYSKGHLHSIFDNELVLKIQLKKIKILFVSQLPKILHSHKIH